MKTTKCKWASLLHLVLFHSVSYPKAPSVTLSVNETVTPSSIWRYYTFLKEHPFTWIFLLLTIYSQCLVFTKEKSYSSEMTPFFEILTAGRDSFLPFKCILWFTHLFNKSFWAPAPLIWRAQRKLFLPSMFYLGDRKQSVNRLICSHLKYF